MPFRTSAVTAGRRKRDSTIGGENLAVWIRPGDFSQGDLHGNREADHRKQCHRIALFLKNSLSFGWRDAATETWTRRRLIQVIRLGREENELSQSDIQKAPKMRPDIQMNRLQDILFTNTPRR